MSHASKHPLVAHKLSRLRDKSTDPKRFRELVREISALLVYEATTDLSTVPRDVETPMAKMTGAGLKEKIGLGADPACRFGDGGGDLGINALSRSLAYRFISRRTNTQTG